MDDLVLSFFCAIFVEGRKFHGRGNELLPYYKIKKLE